MPSAAYFRRQADICLRLSLIASDEEVSNRLIIMAREYGVKADAAEEAARADGIATFGGQPSGGEVGPECPRAASRMLDDQMAVTAATRVARPAVAPGDVMSVRRRGRKAGPAAAPG